MARGEARLRGNRDSWLLIAAALPLLFPSAADATDFRVGEVAGLLDVRLSYGLLARVEGRDARVIALSSGGRAPLSDLDDGDLNYDKGIVSNVLRGSADLTLSWRGLGAFVRGYGFYDFENDLGDRERTPLSSNAEDDVAAGGDLLDHYLSARFDVFGMPIQLRVGDQVLNWGETTFLRNSVDVINPIDFNQALQPGSEARDAFRPLGMVWGAATVTEILSLEAFYQYEWKDVRGPPIGSFFSGNDAIGSDGLNILMLGGGRFSDLGTDLDQTYGLPPGTLGFDADFMKLPGIDRDPPKDGEQYGFTVTMLVPEWNATKLAWHYIHYHSRLPLLNGRTADQQTIIGTSQLAVDARAAGLEADGLSPAEALAAAEDITTSGYANAAGYEVVYPEGIDMIGTSFNTAISATGTLLAGEMAHRFDLPLQRGLGAVVKETLSPILFTGGSSEFGAEEAVKGFVRRDKTQAAFNVTQLFGPQLGASRSALSFDVAWAYVHDAPDDDPNLSNSSWGYRLAGRLTYDNLLGGVSMTPFVLFTHDVDGVSPGPGGAFVEDRKSLTVGLGFVYLNAWTANLSYTGLFDAGIRNPIIDRDSVRLSVAYSF